MGAARAANLVPTNRTTGELEAGRGYRQPWRCFNWQLWEFLKVIPQFQIEPGFKVPFFPGNLIHIPTLPLTWS
jgi:hypothetical protein